MGLIGKQDAMALEKSMNGANFPFFSIAVNGANPGVLPVFSNRKGQDC